MKRYFALSLLTPLILFANLEAYSAPCAFDKAKNCTLQRDILNATSANGLKYFGATDYDHRVSGEINVYRYVNMVSYQDSVNAPGQVRLKMKKNNGDPAFLSSEFMTRANLKAWPINRPQSAPDTLPWTTKDIKHGYLEVRAKLPKCEVSNDGACQNGRADNSYNAGLWPAIWMMPTMDANWPINGEIDIMEAYAKTDAGPQFDSSTIFIHFPGRHSKCAWGDCVGPGLKMGQPAASSNLWNDFHTWGFEWEPDPKSTMGGQIITFYFDNQIASGSPMRTDDLPKGENGADGPGALSRGFNNGYYLIVNLAVGGPYAGPPHPQMTESSFYIQSVKAFDVSGGSGPGPGPVTDVCQPPVNIQYLVSSDNKQATFGWEAPTKSAQIVTYQINDWQDKQIWKGTKATDRAWADVTLPGSPKVYDYNFYTVCANGLSKALKFGAKIPK